MDMKTASLWCVKKRVFFSFKELKDHLDYHFYRSEWETCKKLGLSDDFLQISYLYQLE